MKKNIICFTLATGLVITGCSSNEENKESLNSYTNSTTQEESKHESSVDVEFVPELEVSFGRDEVPFTMNLFDNDTARAIYRFVGTSDWNLPIYHYDDYEHYEVMQYYDIPDRYKIPSNPETITSQKAGEVFYSAPNRIVLFYQDANVSGEYTRLGYFDATGEFVSAVEKNRVVEGYSNKIVSIKSAN